MTPSSSASEVMSQTPPRLTLSPAPIYAGIDTASLHALLDKSEAKLRQLEMEVLAAQIEIVRARLKVTPPDSDGSIIIQNVFEPYTKRIGDLKFFGNNEYMELGSDEDTINVSLVQDCSSLKDVSS